MVIFDQYLLEELTMQYKQTNLTKYDYEKLYILFCNLDHLTEVQPYLNTIRFYCLSTVPEKKTVLSELKEKLNEDDCVLKDLYYDLLK